MNITSDPNLWAICILVFLLGLLIGVFLTAGGRRKWSVKECDTRESEWRERDSLRAAAIMSGRDADDDRPL